MKVRKVNKLLNKILITINLLEIYKKKCSTWKKIKFVAQYYTLPLCITQNPILSHLQIRICCFSKYCFIHVQMLCPKKNKSLTYSWTNLSSTEETAVTHKIHHLVNRNNRSQSICFMWTQESTLDLFICQFKTFF